MFRLVVLSSILCAIAYAGTFNLQSLIPDGRIVGGVPIEIEDAPYQVSLRKNGQHSCGGSVIGARLILTAAHCIFNGWSTIEVYAGTNSLKQGGEKYKVLKGVYHSQYSGSTLDNDVALLLLAEPLKFSKSIASVSLADYEEKVQDDVVAISTGWGNLKYGGSSPDILQSVQLGIYNQETCKKNLKQLGTVTDNMICAGGKEDLGVCHGDSGGALIVNNKVVGVVSWGYQCAKANYPGVFARVSAVRSWIDTTSNDLLSQNP